MNSHVLEEEEESMAESNILSPPGLALPPTPTPRKINVGTTATLVGISCTLLTVVVAFALVWISVQQGAIRRRNDTVSRETPFCCPAEAAKLFAVIDKQGVPCENFFEYVCRNALNQGYIQQNVAHEILGTSNYTVQAAATLQAFYRSCVTEIWQPDLRLKGAIEAVIEIANTTKRMSPALLLHFALEVQIRYKLNFPVTVDVDRGKMYFGRYLRLSDDYSPFCDHDCYATALAAVNAHIGANCTLEEVSQWEQLFTEDYSGPRSVSWDEIRAIFGGIEADEFRAILFEFRIDVNAIKSVFLVPGTQLIADIRRLWNITNQPVALCHLLVILVMDVMQLAVRSDATLSEPTIHSSEACEAPLYQNNHLWRITRVAALTSPEKDRQMRAIFEATRHSFVGYEPLRRIVAAGNDTAAFESLVSNMSLLLPVDLVLPEKTIPLLPSSGFIRNMMRLVSFEYEANVELKRRRLPVSQHTSWKDRILFMGSGSRLYVTPSSYAWLSTGTTNPLLADAPVLGSRIASWMWTNVYAWGWSEATVQAFRAFQKCVKQSQRLREYGNERQLFPLTMGLRIAATMGATSSGTGNNARAEWFRMKSAWSLYRMSEAQFFYARYAYFQCSEDKAPSVVNGPTLRSADFVAAFDCQRGSKDATETGCAGVAPTPGTFGG
ncbi:hypothetical protein HPB52_000293 [Rhipicephalus sanguineus]|uniref:Uncharacterized protein n=1 Tax=Rhipicephalus sanguineus TaxID=34632 RepID=A0A9D4PEB3_RHISA|nr:hypothetical protein HPB52_000293 [Rhipicephalus sanguineus]